MLDTETILILVALVSAIVGTLWDAKRWGKIAIICLAVVAAGTAVFESQKKASEKAAAIVEAESARRNVELIIRAVQPPEVFDTAVLAGFRKVARDNKLYVAGQDIREGGSRIFEFKKIGKDDEVAGVVLLDLGRRQEMFLGFAHRKDLEAGIKEVLYGKWGEDNLEKDWNQFAMNTYQIAKNTLESLTPPNTEFTGHFDAKARSIAVEVTFAGGRSVGSIDFDAGFMKRLSGVPPIERGRLISIHTLAQVSR